MKKTNNTTKKIKLPDLDLLEKNTQDLVNNTTSQIEFHQSRYQAAHENCLKLMAELEDQLNINNDHSAKRHHLQESFKEFKGFASAAKFTFKASQRNFKDLEKKYAFLNTADAVSPDCASKFNTLFNFLKTASNALNTAVNQVTELHTIETDIKALELKISAQKLPESVQKITKDSEQMIKRIDSFNKTLMECSKVQDQLPIESSALKTIQDNLDKAKQLLEDTQALLLHTPPTMLSFSAQAQSLGSMTPDHVSELPSNHEVSKRATL